jgi:hypothetical protein
MSWAKRIAKQQRRCDACWGVIDVEETYYLVVGTGERWCCDCPPEDESA